MLPFLQSLAITILVSASMNWMTLGTSFKWIHTIFVLLPLAAFTKCVLGSSRLSHISEFHFFLRLNNTPSYVYITLLIYPSIDGHSGCFHLWAIVNTVL